STSPAATVGARVLSVAARISFAPPSRCKNPPLPAGLTHPADTLMQSTSPASASKVHPSARPQIGHGNCRDTRRHASFFGPAGMDETSPPLERVERSGTQSLLLRL